MPGQRYSILQEKWSWLLDFQCSVYCSILGSEMDVVITGCHHSDQNSHHTRTSIIFSHTFFSCHKQLKKWCCTMSWLAEHFGDISTIARLKLDNFRGQFTAKLSSQNFPSHTIFLLTYVCFTYKGIRK